MPDAFGSSYPAIPDPAPTPERPWPGTEPWPEPWPGTEPWPKPWPGTEPWPWPKPGPYSGHRQPAALISTHERVCVARFSTRSGRELRWEWTTARAEFGHVVDDARTIVLDTADLEGEPQQLRRPAAPVAPSVEGCFDRRENRLPWLFSPRALSMLCRGELLTAAFHSAAEAADDPATPPRSSTAEWDDSGQGPPTDFDGVARRSRRLLGAGALRPASLRTGTGYAICTGEAGWNGAPLVEDLVRAARGRLPEPEPAERARVALEAHWVAGARGVALATLLEGPLAEPWGYRVAVLRIVGVAELMAAGRWVGPRRRGAGGWVSPWFELGSGSRAVTVVHVPPAERLAESLSERRRVQPAGKPSRTAE